MTILTKPIKRELPLTFDRRSWIVELQPWGINFRAKRTRQTFPITWETIWAKAQHIAAELARKERAERRKARKGAKLAK
jgi:hypothetical protein